MNEATRHEIVRRFQAGQSQRHIARDLHLSRHTVRHVLAEIAHQRAQGMGPPALQPRERRARQLDAYDAALQELLRRHPQLTARRLWEELQTQGFAGGYKQVWTRVRELRPRPRQTPVVRFESGRAQQAQMDYSVHDLDFTVEGRRRVYLFSYVLGYSRRAYLHWVEAQDLETTLRQHIRAFTYLGGVAATCLYDNMKVVVLRWQDGEPVYNPRFLAFATHYGYRPVACKPYRPQTKGKCERSFDYVQKSLLAGRTFPTLQHLNDVTAWWLEHVADVRVLRPQQQTPRQLHAEEKPHLLPLPACPYPTDTVVHRTVDAEGFIAWRGNHYSVPWSQLGQLLPVRLTETEVIVYGPTLVEIARHPLLPRNTSGQRCVQAAHHPPTDTRLAHAQLQERFTALGPVALRFFEGLVQRQRYSRSQAQQILALLGTYAVADLRAALERAVRYGAFTATAVERILAARARPKTALEKLAELEPDYLEPLLGKDPVVPRPTSDYRRLFVEDSDHAPTPPSGATATGPPPGAAEPPANPENQPRGSDAGRPADPGGT
jgi:transposase